jgi:hypothetical protein
MMITRIRSMPLKYLFFTYRSLSYFTSTYSYSYTYSNTSPSSQQGHNCIRFKFQRIQEATQSSRSPVGIELLARHGHLHYESTTTTPSSS